MKQLQTPIRAVSLILDSLEIASPKNYAQLPELRRRLETYSATRTPHPQAESTLVIVATALVQLDQNLFDILGT